MENKKLRVSFDIGGVLSKYPNEFRTMARALAASPDIEVFVITDMHIHDQSVGFVHSNGFEFIPAENILNSNYTDFGERCKEQTILDYGIDIHIDDFPGYCAHTNAINLFVWPNPNEPYYSDDWVTDGSEGNFGRRIKPKVKE